jgi:hypothetical protein
MCRTGVDHSWHVANRQELATDRDRSRGPRGRRRVPVTAVALTIARPAVDGRGPGSTRDHRKPMSAAPASAGRADDESREPPDPRRAWRAFFRREQRR